MSDILNNEQAKQALEFFKGKGWTQEQAAGIVGNLWHESGGLNTKARNRGDGRDGSDSIGIAQWNSDRARGLAAFAEARGTSSEDLGTQLEYVQHELDTTERRAADRLRAAASVEQAVDAFLGFERPQDFSWENPRASHGYSSRASAAFASIGIPVPAAYGAPAAASGGAASGPFPEAPSADWLNTPGTLEVPDALKDFQSRPAVPSYAAALTEAEARGPATTAAEDVGTWFENFYESTLLPDLNRNKRFEIDPDFRYTKESFAEYTAGIPEDFHDRFLDANSAAEAKAMRELILSRMDQKRRIASLGWGAELSSTLLGAVLDPVGIAAGIFTGGIGALASKGAVIGRLSRAGYGAASGAAIEAGLAGYKYAHDPVSTADQVLYAALGGAALGAAFGALSGGALPRPGGHLEDISRRLGAMQDEVAAGQGGDSLGAARAPYDAGRPDLATLTQDLGGADDFAGGNKAVLSWARFDEANRLKSSPIPAIRQLGEALMEDGVGNANRLLEAGEHASVTQLQIQHRLVNLYHQAYKPLFAEYLEETGGSWMRNPVERAQAKSRFNALIADAVRNTDPTVSFSPSVTKAAGAFSDTMARIGELANNPGLIDGTVRAAVPGFENWSRNDNYLARIFNREAWNNAIANHGTFQVVEAFKKAMRDGVWSRPDGMSPEDYEALLEAVASGYVRRVSKLSAGMEADFSTRWSGNNLDLLRDELRQAGMTDEQVESAIKAIDKRPEGATARGRFRTIYNENTSYSYDSIVTGKRETITIRDLFENDSSKLLEMTVRQLSGQVAMARVRVLDHHGEIILDGIRSKEELKAVSDAVRDLTLKQGMGEAGLAHANDAVKTLNWAYDRITGVPHESQTGLWGEVGRVFRQYNFVRLMGNAGFAQIPEIGNIVATMGVKAAFRGMPSLRALRRQIIAGRLQWADELTAELDAATAIGSENFRGGLNARFDLDGDHYAYGQGIPRWLRGAQEAGQLASRGVANLSGIAPITTMLQTWAGRSIVHKFGELAAKPTKANLERLASVGLGKDMLDRVLEQFRKHATWERGQIGARVRRMNRDAWDDLQAAAAFDRAIFQLTRRMVQENDIGSMNRIMSHAWMQVFLQFKGFQIGAWTKNMMYNMHMRDLTTAKSFLFTSTAAALVYMLRTHLSAQGRSDKEEYLEKYLSMEKIGAAAFTNGGWSSLLPMLADTPYAFVTGKGYFDTRNSGLSSGITGSPTIDFFENGARGLGAALRAGTSADEEFSQQDLRSITRLLPLGNFLPLAALFNELGGDLPEK